jgi:hypothetical protein
MMLEKSRMKILRDKFTSKNGDFKLSGGVNYYSGKLKIKKPFDLADQTARN